MIPLIALECLRSLLPMEFVNVIKILYKDTTASVVTPKGETEPFTIRRGVLQGDPLAPFLFVIVLDYALRTSITSNHVSHLNVVKVTTI